MNTASVSRSRNWITDQVRTRLKAEIVFPDITSANVPKVWIFRGNGLGAIFVNGTNGLAPYGWQTYFPTFENYYIGGSKITVTVTNLSPDNCLNLSVKYRDEEDSPTLDIDPLPWSNRPDARSKIMGPSVGGKNSATISMYCGTKKAFGRRGQISNEEDFQGTVNNSSTQYFPTNPDEEHSWFWHIGLNSVPAIEAEFMNYVVKVVITYYITFEDRRELALPTNS